MLQAKEKMEKAELDDEERAARFIEEQIQRAELEKQVNYYILTLSKITTFNTITYGTHIILLITLQLEIC